MYVPNTQNENNVSKKSKRIAFWLCWFTGLWGGHRFYVGKTGTGLIWLFSGGCFFVGLFMDLIKIHNGEFTDKDGKPIIYN